MATSHSDAALNKGSVSGASIRARASSGNRAGTPAAQSSTCVSRSTLTGRIRTGVAISSAPMRSKSCGTATSPTRNPTRRLAGVGASRATTLTTGFPARAMMNGSPLAAAATSRDRWVLASCMLTVRNGIVFLNLVSMT